MLPSSTSGDKDLLCFIAWLIFVVAVIALWSYVLGYSSPAKAQTRYASPDLSEYYAALKQPDNPSVSCCGWADAYYADKTDSCGPQDEVDCALVAIITDERPNTMTLPDGRTLVRPPIPVGTRISIPQNKLRRPAIVNPTDHNIVFVAYPGGYTRVYCWEPAALI
jgi:hypothetical protein